MPLLELINGETITYPEPTGELAAFIERVWAMSADPKATEDHLIALIYGRGNPLLDHAMLPGRSMVTAATVARPEWPLFGEAIDRKRIALGEFDVEAAKARHTLTVDDVAKRLGVNASAVYQAIQARRLSVWKAEGRYLIDPASVASFEGQRRGPAPRLEVKTGSRPGLSFRVKAPTPFEGQPREGLVTRWKRIAVIIGEEKDYRAMILEPGGETQSIEAGDFYVRGRFTVVVREDNPRKAREMFTAFKAA
jgi:excisionase family DNA binding protein